MFKFLSLFWAKEYLTPAGSSVPPTIKYWHEKKTLRIFTVQRPTPSGELDPLKKIG